jgi:hypothetical protein
MLYTGRIGGVAALLALMCLGPVVRGADPEQLQDLQREVQELRREVASLRALIQASNRTSNLEIDVLTNRLTRLEKLIASSPPTASSRIASSFTPEPPSLRSALRLDNRLPVTATVIVNGISYTVGPFRMVTLRNQLPGEITYQVTAEGRGMGLPVRSALVADQTLTVTIR